MSKYLAGLILVSMSLLPVWAQDQSRRQVSPNANAQPLPASTHNEPSSSRPSGTVKGEDRLISEICRAIEFGRKHGAKLRGAGQGLSECQVISQKSWTGDDWRQWGPIAEQYRGMYCATRATMTSDEGHVQTDVHIFFWADQQPAYVPFKVVDRAFEVSDIPEIHGQNWNWFPRVVFHPKGDPRCADLTGIRNAACPSDPKQELCFGFAPAMNGNPSNFKESEDGGFLSFTDMGGNFRLRNDGTIFKLAGDDWLPGSEDLKDLLLAELKQNPEGTLLLKRFLERHHLWQNEIK